LSQAISKRDKFLLQNIAGVYYKMSRFYYKIRQLQLLQNEPFLLQNTAGITMNYYFDVVTTPNQHQSINREHKT